MFIQLIFCNVFQIIYYVFYISIFFPCLLVQRINQLIILTASEHLLKALYTHLNFTLCISFTFIHFINFTFKTNELSHILFKEFLFYLFSFPNQFSFPLFILRDFIPQIIYPIKLYLLIDLCLYIIRFIHYCGQIFLFRSPYSNCFLTFIRMPYYYSTRTAIVLLNHTYVSLRILIYNPRHVIHIYIHILQTLILIDFDDIILLRLKCLFRLQLFPSYHSFVFLQNILLLTLSKKFLY